MLFLNIYNMLVDSVTRHWAAVVAREFAVPEGFRRAAKIWPQFSMHMIG